MRDLRRHAERPFEKRFNLVKRYTMFSAFVAIAAIPIKAFKVHDSPREFAYHFAYA